MVDLTDIAPSQQTVLVRGTPIQVGGVSARGVALLLARFPALRRLFAGRSVEEDDLFKMGGEAVCAIIACGLGKPGDEVTEAAADQLSIDEQADLLSAIMKATLPRGVGPFIDKVTELGLVLGVADQDQSTRVQGTTSEKPSKN